jgi:hypothetical protein
VAGAPESVAEREIVEVELAVAIHRPAILAETERAWPGGNVTGNSSDAGGEVFAKPLSLIREVKPTIPRTGVLWDYAPSAFESRDGERPLLVDHPTRAFVFAQ